MTSVKRALAIIVIFHILLMPAAPILSLFIFFAGALSDGLVMGIYVMALAGLGFGAGKLAYIIYPQEIQYRSDPRDIKVDARHQIPAIDVDMLLAARDDTDRLRRVASSFSEEIDRKLLMELASRIDAVLSRAADDSDARRSVRNLLSYRLPKLVQLAQSLEDQPSTETEKFRCRRVRGIMEAAMQSIDQEGRSRARIDDIHIDADLNIMERELQEHLHLQERLQTPRSPV